MCFERVGGSNPGTYLLPIREGAQKSRGSLHQTYAPAHVYAFARMRVHIYTSVHLRPNGTRHPRVYLRPYTRRRVGLAFIIIMYLLFLYTPNYCAAGEFVFVYP